MNHGIVEDVTDPSKMGRVRVRVQQIHGPEILTEDLPWSLVVSPTNSPSYKGKGHSTNLLVGTAVVGYFLDAMLQDFIVFGTIPTTSPETDEDDGICSISEHTTKKKCEEAGGYWGKKDNNIRVRGEADPNADQEKGVLEPASSYSPEYPYNNVFESESGHVKEYDDTPGNERIYERHKSGSLVEIKPDGTKLEKIVRDRYTLVLHNDTLEVQGSVNLVVSENCNLAVAGNVTANVGGTTDIQGVDNITVKVTGTDKSITLDGDVNVTKTLRTNTGDSDSTINVNTHEHVGDSGDVPPVNTGVPIPE